uniref:Uncharacterized protein n=1 Tax=Salarias fasciatus TaxID=181472 RepID=A0A672IAU8_SALFA
SVPRKVFKPRRGLWILVLDGPRPACFRCLPLGKYLMSNERVLVDHFTYPPPPCRSYNELKHCVDDWANKTWCRGRGFLADEIFLEVHQSYFALCGQVHDPPLFTLIMLIAPGIVVTFFLPLLCVHLTTWNTEMPGTLGL